GSLRPATDSLGLVLLWIFYLTSAGKTAAQGISGPGPLYWLLPAGGIVGCYGLFQAAGIDPFYLENLNRDAVSTLGNTNELAEVMALLIPCALALLFDPGRRTFWLAAVSLPFLVGALWVTGGRAGLIAALCGAVIFGLTCLAKTRPSNKRQKSSPGDASSPVKSRLRILLACLGIGLVLGGIIGSHKNLAFKRIDSDVSIFNADYPTNRARIEIWKSTWELILDHSVLGVGPGGFRSAYPPYRNPLEAQLPGFMGARTEVRDPHNEYLWAAAEGGFPAAICLIVFFFLLFRYCLKGATEAPHARERVFCAGAAGVVFAFAVLCLFRAPLHNPAAAVLFFVIAGQALGARVQRPSLPALLPGKPFSLFQAIVSAVVIICSCWIGGRGLASDWLAASTAMKEKLGPEEFKAFQHAADIDPENLDIINFVGQTAANQLMGTQADKDRRFRDEAVKRLNRVLEINPYHPDALGTLGRIRALEGDIEEARALLTRFHQVSGEPGDPEDTLWKLLDEAGKDKEAAAILAERFEDQPRLLLERAKELMEAKRLETALVYTDRYLMQHPFDGDALHLLGNGLRELYDEGHKDVFRRMHLAYALEWIASKNWEEATGSIKRSLRYGEGAGEAPLLAAIIEAGKGGDFVPPEEKTENQALLDHLREMAAEGRLPESVSEYFKK
ncbi:MAG: O-antigen ligase family protein, partial [Planctomycetes bacterium]|nr:O-antigen ligase family protein [Planctomycetota bacterium]